MTYTERNLLTSLYGLKDSVKDTNVDDQGGSGGIGEADDSSLAKAKDGDDEVGGGGRNWEGG